MQHFYTFLSFWRDYTEKITQKEAPAAESAWQRQHKDQGCLVWYHPPAFIIRCYSSHSLHIKVPVSWVVSSCKSNPPTVPILYHVQPMLKGSPVGKLPSYGLSKMMTTITVPVIAAAAAAAAAAVGGVVVVVGGVAAVIAWQEKWSVWQLEYLVTLEVPVLEDRLHWISVFLSCFASLRWDGAVHLYCVCMPGCCLILPSQVWWCFALQACLLMWVFLHFSC